MALFRYILTLFPGFVCVNHSFPYCSCLYTHNMVNPYSMVDYLHSPLTVKNPQVLESEESMLKTCFFFFSNKINIAEKDWPVHLKVAADSVYNFFSVR